MGPTYSVKSAARKLYSDNIDTAQSAAILWVISPIHSGSVIQQAMEEQGASVKSRSLNRSKSSSRSSPEGMSGCLAADILSYCFSWFLHSLLGSRRKERAWEREEFVPESFKDMAVLERQDSVRRESSSSYVIDRATKLSKKKKKVNKVNKKVKIVKKKAYVKRK